MGFFGGMPPFMGMGGFGGMGMGGFPGYVGPDLYNMPHSHQEAEEIRERRSDFMQKFFITMATLIGLGALITALQRPNIWYKAQHPKEPEKPRDTFVSQHRQLESKQHPLEPVRVGGYTYYIEQHQDPADISICRDHEKAVEAKSKKLLNFDRFLEGKRSIRAGKIVKRNLFQKDPELKRTRDEFLRHLEMTKPYNKSLNPEKVDITNYEQNKPGSPAYTKTLEDMQEAIEKHFIDHDISDDLLSWRPEPAEAKQFKRGDFSLEYDAPHVNALNNLRGEIKDYLKQHQFLKGEVKGAPEVLNIHDRITELVKRLPR